MNNTTLRAVAVLSALVLFHLPVTGYADPIADQVIEPQTNILTDSVVSPVVDASATQQRLLQMLDYVGVDYPPTVTDGVIVDQVEYAEMLEFSGEMSIMLDELPGNDKKEDLSLLIAQLQQSVEKRVAGDQISQLTQSIKADLIAAYNINTSPAKIPDMTVVPALFQAHCASCHGAEGRGDGALAEGMQPAPSNFHDMQRQINRSVYDLYNTITLGVTGTPMASFAQLSEDDRWALAFTIGGYPVASGQRGIGKILWQQGQMQEAIGSLEELSKLTYAQVPELAKKSGLGSGDANAILAYLRSNPAVFAIADNEALDLSIRKLGEAVEHLKSNDRKAAHKAALSAYLDGFELAENNLTVVDKEMRIKIEREMIAFRELTKTGEYEILEAKYQTIINLLQNAKRILGTTEISPTAAFAGSFIILLREGVEAILVLAAIMAALIKTGRREALKYIHAGWIGAVVLGLLTWVVAENLIAISGASREVTEGVAALFAAAILVYVGFWLHNASSSKRWKQFIEHRIDNAMEGGTLWVLAFVSFLAVYREMFETVLFYQSMWVQIQPESHNGFILGILVAIGCLVVLSIVTFKVGVKLPIKTFFQVNAILLFVLAVVFSGQGIAALQEAGVISSTLISFPTVSVLGVYPTLQSLGLQLFVLFVGAGLLAYQRKADHE